MMAALATGEHPPEDEYNAHLKELAAKITRSMLEASTLTARKQGKKQEKARLVSILQGAQQKLDAALADAVECGCDDVGSALKLDLTRAKVAVTTFKKTLPGEPEFFAAALEAAHDFITDQEELELTQPQRAVVLLAVRLEVNAAVGSPVR